MAHINYIGFSHVGRTEGCLCDRCGQYIRNIVTVRYDDGVSVSLGQDCFDKVCKDSHLSDYGMKLMHKTVKRIDRYTKDLEMWKNLTYEEAKEKGLAEELDPDSPINAFSKSYWCGRTFDEYKNWMVTVWFPARFKESQKEIERFKKVNFVK